MVLDDRRPASHVLLLFLLGITLTILSSKNCCVDSLSLDYFYPYNISTDKSTPEKDDGGSGQVNISTPFHFYEGIYKTIYISNNGIISFNKEFSDQYQPQNFPINGTALVAPFWADVDIEKVPGGHVWYGESQDPLVLERASCDVRTHLPQNHSCFTATWVFVTTWYNVGYYGATKEGKNKRNVFQTVLISDDRSGFIMFNYHKIEWTMGQKSEGNRNTFQAVLISDGQSGFVMFNYHKIEWTTGQNSEGNVSTGLGGEEAQSCTICRHRPTKMTCSGNDHIEWKSIEQQVAGYNAECCNRSKSVKGSATPEVKNLTHVTNVNLRGRVMFSLSRKPRGKPSISNELTVTPSSATMLGGEKINISAMCLSRSCNSVIEARFQELEVNFTCRVTGLDHAECIVPSVFQTGEVTLSVQRTRVNCSNSLPDATANFSILNIDPAETKVQRNKPASWHVNSMVEIAWTKRDFPARNIILTVLGYKSDLPSWNILFTKNITKGNNTRKFQLSAQNSSDFLYTTAIVRLCDADTENRYCVFSDIFAINWNDPEISSRICTHWAEEEELNRRKKKLTSTTCPGTRRQAQSDSGTFRDYDFCDITSSGSGTATNNVKPSCHFVNTAKCFQLFSPTENGGNQICCYSDDKDGRFMYAEKLDGWGTAQRYHSRGDGRDNVPTITNFEKDIVPMLHCVHWGSSSELYYSKRPHSSAKGFIPPKVGQCAGDPHLVTLDDTKYTFNGLGEYTYIQHINHTFVVQIRTSQAIDTKGNRQLATIVNAIVMGGDGKSTVEIRRNSSTIDSAVEILIDKRIIQLEVGKALQKFTLKGISMTVKQDKTLIKSLLVIFDGIGLAVDVEPNPYLLNIILTASQELKGKVEGLLGNYNDDKSDDFRPRNSDTSFKPVSDRQIHKDFGSSWFVGNESLFTYEPGVGAENFTNESFEPVFLDEQEFMEAEKKICGDNPECLFDLNVTNNTAFAELTKKFVNMFKQRQKDNEKVIICDIPPDLKNKTKNFTGTAMGDKAEYTCVDNNTEIVNPEKVCQSDGNWSPVDAQCIPVDKEKFKPWIWGLAGGGTGILFIGLIATILFIIKRCRKGHKKVLPRSSNRNDPGFDFRGPQQDIELQEWEIQHFIFMNDSFWQQLQNMPLEDGSFRIPRPFIEDKELYDAYF